MEKSSAELPSRTTNLEAQRRPRADDDAPSERSERRDTEAAEPSNEIERARQAIEEAREILENERRAAAGHWEKKLSEMEQLQAELHNERDALRAERDALIAARQPRQETDEASDPVVPAVVEAIDEEASAEAEAAEAAQAAADAEAVEKERDITVTRPTPAQQAPKMPDDDDSIEAHIAAFLGRIGGGAKGAAPEPPKRRAVKPAPVAQHSPSKPKPAPAAVETSAAPVSVPMATELTQRSRPQVTDLSAMRELANAQARIAIHTHSRQRLLKTILIRAGGAALCLAMGGAALNLGDNADGGLFAAAMACIVAGIYWIVIGSRDVQQFIDWRNDSRSNALSQAVLREQDPACQAVEAAGQESPPAEALPSEAVV